MKALPTWAVAHEGRSNGTYLVVTQCGRWGRGKSLLEAMANAKKAGARGKFMPKTTLIIWQPDSAWQKILELQKKMDPAGNSNVGYRGHDGNRRDPADRPFVGSDGSIYSWGGDIEYLHRPNQ